MLKLKKSGFLKAVTVSALMIKGGVSSDGDSKKEKEIARTSNTSNNNSYQGHRMADIILQNHSLIEQRTRDRQNLLRAPRIIDLAYKPFDNVRNFLENARYYNVKAKLTVNGASESQLDELFSKYGDVIDTLQWSSTATSDSKEKTPDKETLTPWHTTPYGDTDDEEDDEEDEETPTPTPYGDTDDEEDDEEDEETPTPTKGDDGFDRHIDGGRMPIPVLRRAVARGRFPIGLGDLRDNLGQEINLVPKNKLLFRPTVASLPVLPNANEYGVGKDAPTSRAWRITPVSDQGSSVTTSNIHASSSVQPHALVKLFCRGKVGAVQS